MCTFKPVFLPGNSLQGLILSLLNLSVEPKLVPQVEDELSDRLVIGAEDSVP